MRLTALILLLLMVHTFAIAQYYFTGEVDGLHSDKLQHVAITVQSTGATFHTGTEGDFSITSRLSDDSATFVYDGYERYTTAIRSTDFLRVTLKAQPGGQKVQRVPLLSLKEGPTKVSFAGHTNGLSYTLVKRFIGMGNPVPVEAVKIEELLNYFNTAYEVPDPPAAFHSSSVLLDCPWDRTHRLLLLNISGRQANMEQLPPNNLVLLIDVSGSMDMPNKLPLIKASLRPLIRNLRATDTVSIVEFGTRMRVMVGIPGSAKEVLTAAIEQLQPDGPSPGAEALRLAYQVARHQFIQGGNNRIIFATDGDICSGKSEAESLGEYIGEQRQDGIGLSCIGVGVTDSSSRELPYFSEQGKGRFIPISGEEQGEEALLNELAVSPIADNVSVTAEFDTTLGTGYRLIGFDNKPGVRADTVLQGCSMTPGQSLMAVFEFVPKKDTAGILARVRINYCLPGRAARQAVEYDCPGDLVSWDRATPCQRRAACVALFGMKLRGVDDADGVSWSEVQKLTKQVFPGSNFIDREYLSLVTKARRIYEKDDRSASRGYHTNP